MESLATLIEAIPFQSLEQGSLALDFVIRSALLVLLFNWFVDRQQQQLSADSMHRALLILLSCLSLFPLLSSLASFALGQEHAITLFSVLLPNSASWSDNSIIESTTTYSALVFLYFSGVLLLGFRLLLSLIRITFLRHTAHYCFDSSDVQLLNQVKSKLNVSAQIQLGYSPFLNAPVSFGWVTPVILVPVTWQEWGSNLRLSVMQHEVAHIKRKDWLVSLFGECVAILYWFNPVLWHVKQRMESVSEQACDALAIEHGSDRIEYAEHLVLLARSCSAQAKVARLSNPIAQIGGMSARIEAILSGASNQSLLGKLQLILLCSMLFIAAFSPVRVIAVEDAKLFRTPRLLHSALPVYNPQDVWLSLPAHIRVRYDIDARGKVDTDSIRVISSPDHTRLSPAVVEAVKKFQYEPRLVRGAPAPARNLEWSLMIRGHNAIYRR